MEVSIICDNSRKILKENIPIPFYRGCLISFQGKNNTKQLDLFTPEILDNGITLIPSQFPNKKSFSLEKIRAIMNLFPVIKEKYYDKSGLIVFNVIIDSHNELPITVLLVFDTEIYAVCLTLIGGEYSRNPGSSIMLLGVEKLKDGNVPKLVMTP